MRRYSISQRLILLASIVIAFALGAPPVAGSGDKVVLLIGNSKYVNTRTLNNPANDVNALSPIFRKIGFDVKVGIDLSYVEMRRALRQFADLSAKRDIAVIYFAGHGLERGGENYLIPVDAKLENDIDLEYEAITLSSTLLAVMQAKKLRLVVLDACRTNPFGEKMKTSLGLTRAVARGLARVEPHGDILVAYSAKAGTVAFDGEGPLSPYATAMLKHIEHPGLDVRLLMGKVRDDVMVATARKQEPFIYGSLSGDIIPLVPAPAGASGEAAQSLLVAEERKKAAAAEVLRKLEEARVAEMKLKLQQAEENAKREKLAAQAAAAAREEAEERAEQDRAAKEKAEEERVAALRVQEEQAERLAEEAAQARKDAEEKARSLTLRIKSTYPYTMQVEFYSQSGNRVWPGGNKAYTLLYDQDGNYALSCIPGEKICYGAWARHNTKRYWGCGYGCQQRCSDCCYTCGGGDPSIHLTRAPGD